MRRYLLLALLVGCSSTPETEQEQDEPLMKLPAPTSADLPRGSIVRTSRDSDFEQMIEELAKADVVYLGEKHDEADHHLGQLRIIEHLHARGRLHAIGMEMFQRRFQPVLDEFTEGEIGEEELVRRTEYERRWGYDFDLYRPILRFAQKWRLPVVALNVDDEIRAKVSEGGLDALTQEERAALPALDLGNAEHRAFVRRSFETQHGDAKNFERFYLVMCLWEDVMADSVVRWFRTAPENGQIVVLAGSGHISNRYGLPDRVEARIGKTNRTVVPVSVGKGSPERGMYGQGYADYLWLTRGKEEPEGGSD